MTDIQNTEISDRQLEIGARVVAVGHAGRVHLLDLETGRAYWTRDLALEKGASACQGQPVSVRISDFAVIAGSMGHVFAIRIDNGTVAWRLAEPSRGAGETSLSLGVVGPPVQRP